MKRLFLFFLLLLFCGFALPAQAVTRYVAKSGQGGSDSNTCTQAQSIDTPKLTIVAGLACTQPGDRLQIREGTYAEFIKTSTQTIPSGSNWNDAPIIERYQNEVVTIRPNGTPYAIVEILGTHDYMIFQGLVFDAVNVSNYHFNLGGTGGRIRLANNEMKNSPRSSILVGKDSNFNEILDNYVHDGGTVLTGTSCCGYGIYLQGSDNLVRGNRFEFHTGYGIHNYNGHTGSSSNRNKMIRNRVKNNATDSGATQSAGIMIGSGTENKAEYNVVIGHPFGIMVAQNGATNNEVNNNTVYGATIAGVLVKAGMVGTKVRNNLLYNNVYTTNNGVRVDGGSVVTQTNNRTSNPNYKDAAGGDFTLLAGSLAIDAGTAIAGYNHNGNALDQGAYETIGACTGAVLDTASDNTMTVSCQNNRFPPLLPSGSGCSGFSTRRDGIGNQVTSCVRTGDGQFTLTLQDAILGGQSVDFSYAPGNVVDSSGGVVNLLPAQPLHSITNQNASNPIGTGLVATLTQTGCIAEGYGGEENAPDYTLSSGTSIAVPPGQCVRVRCGISNTVASYGQSGYSLYADRNNDGAFVVVENGPCANGLCYPDTTQMPPELLAGTTTERLNGPNTFRPGGVILNKFEIPNITLALNEETEQVSPLCIGASVPVGDTFRVRWRTAGGVVLNGGYTDFTIVVGGYTTRLGAR